MSSQPTADQLIADLRLAPLPHEGGWFRRTWADEHSSAILYLLATAGGELSEERTAGGFSALHRLTVPEVYHFHAGAPVRMLLLDSTSGAISQPVLGVDLSAGQVPQLVVGAGVWQGSSTTGAWSLVGTTMAPPYADELFTLGDRDVLTAEFPSAAARIAELTH